MYHLLLFLFVGIIVSLHVFEGVFCVRMTDRVLYFLLERCFANSINSQNVSRRSLFSYATHSVQACLEMNFEEPYIRVLTRAWRHAVRDHSAPLPFFVISCFPVIFPLVYEVWCGFNHLIIYAGCHNMCLTLSMLCVDVAEQRRPRAHPVWSKEGFKMLV